MYSKKNIFQSSLVEFWENVDDCNQKYFSYWPYILQNTELKVLLLTGVKQSSPTVIGGGGTISLLTMFKWLGGDFASPLFLWFANYSEVGRVELVLVGYSLLCFYNNKVQLHQLCNTSQQSPSLDLSTYVWKKDTKTHTITVNHNATVQSTV